MSAYADRVWLSEFDEGKGPDIEREHDSALAMWRATAERAGDRPLIHYFDATLTVADVDRQSDALAAGLLEHGFGSGDRLAVYLQNVPQFIVAMIAAWKAGGIMVSINPMNKARELQLLLDDSGARVLVTHESLYEEVAAGVVPDTGIDLVVTTSELEYVDEVPSVLEGVERSRPEGTLDLLELVREHEGAPPPPVTPKPDDIAFLTYTSGTTGPPKGAMNTHGNVAFNSQTYRDWCEIGDDDVCLAVAPLFHITGLIGHIGVGLLAPMPMVLGYRFDPGTTAGLVERWKATFTVASITVFIALMNDGAVTPEQLATLTKVYSGGAPVAPSVSQAYEERFGAPILIAYGLTETNSPSHLTPLHNRSPVDEKTGALSIGVPVFNTLVRILGEDGEELPTGEVGELGISGPEVVPGYWEKPEETEHAFPGGELRTGDVGFMDERGWFYLVDRKKDQINAAGYKVWPREVEDVLYEHPAVREAAVVGVPDEYRGETVKAFVSLKGDADAAP
ncbi:MAG TPA: AMP-binding protein, partial [Solirubrobacteraceae bacterium]|nr:AMP-binding protein [Solirubrobacteraceae bacterium]